jgi:hypothetical protein
MKTAYICSPYRGEIEGNVEYAKELTKEAIKRGYAPVTPHLYLTQCLDDNNAGERALGLTVGLELLDKVDIAFVGLKYGVSQGMKAEIKKAHKLNIPREYYYE